LTGVLLHVGPFDLDPNNLTVIEFHVEVTVERDRLVVLRRLEILRHIRVEVVLAREPAPLGDLTVECQTDTDRRLHPLAIDHRQRPGHNQTPRTDGRVRLATDPVRTTTEHFRARGQLDVYLEPEHGIEVGKHLVDVHEFGRRTHRTAPPFNCCANERPVASLRALSNAAPTRYNRSSAIAGAMSCSPTGIPSSSHNPLGRLIAGMPVRFAGAVHNSARYISVGSSAPSSAAVRGVVGDTSTSTCPNACSKSRWTRVRTR